MNSLDDWIVEINQPNYRAILPEAAASPDASVLVEFAHRLQWLWIDLYELNLPSSGEYLHFTWGTFTYLYDFRGPCEPEEYGPVTMVADRIIGVYGTSRPVVGGRDRNRMRGPLGQAEFGVNREELAFDRGHFIAHCIGGHEDQGLYPQRRDINRGQGELGRVFASMERYAKAHPGTFVFARPIYGDNSAHPFYIEYGLIKMDGELWVEVFPNRYTFTPFVSLDSTPEWFKDFVADERRKVAKLAARQAKRRAEANDRSNS